MLVRPRSRMTQDQVYGLGGPTEEIGKKGTKEKQEKHMAEESRETGGASSSKEGSGREDEELTLGELARRYAKTGLSHEVATEAEEETKERGVRSPMKRVTR